MCQQWFSVGGQILDVIGFLLIAREWVLAINLQGAEHESMKFRPDDEDRKYMWQGWLQQFKLRMGFFKFGAALIILGFLGQALGSLPYGIPYLGFKSC